MSLDPIRRRGGCAEEVALHAVDADFCQEFRVFSGFHKFGDSEHFKMPPDGDQRLCQNLIVGVLVDVRE